MCSGRACVESLIPQPGGGSAHAARMMDGGATASPAASVDSCVINLISPDAAAGETFGTY